MTDWFTLNHGKAKLYLFERYPLMDVYRHEEILQELKYSYFYSVPFIESYFLPNNEKIDMFLDQVANYTNIFIIIGMRRHGKTAFIVWLAEQLHKMGFVVCWIGENRPDGLPDWFLQFSEFVEAPNGSHCFCDETHTKFFSRNFSSKESKAETMELTITGHKGKSIYYTTQNSALVDINIFRLVDGIICKPFSLMQMDTERVSLFEKLSHFLPQTKKECLFLSHTNKFIFENPLPNCWSNKMSTYFR